MVFPIFYLYFIPGFGVWTAVLHVRRLPIRLCLSAIGCLCAWKALAALTNLSSNAPLLSNVGLLMALGVPHAITLSLIERYELPALQAGQRRVDILSRLWPLRHIFPSKVTCNPRWSFVLGRLASVLIVYAAQRIVDYFFPILKFSDFHPAKTSLLRRIQHVTTREIAIRILFAIWHPFTSWSRLRVCHDGFAALSVGMGITGPDEWPYLFGSVKEAYSLRRYWSRFWHRNVYRPYTGLAHLVTGRLFRLRRGSLAYGFMVMFIVFGISGVAHAAVTANTGARCGYWADVHIMMLNFCGIVLEEAVGWVAASTGWDQLLNYHMRRCIGYIWVFSFMFWSTPKLYFPTQRWKCVPLR
jgi:hypothetical protein